MNNIFVCHRVCVLQFITYLQLKIFIKSSTVELPITLLEMQRFERGILIPCLNRSWENLDSSKHYYDTDTTKTDHTNKQDEFNHSNCSWINIPHTLRGKELLGASSSRNGIFNNDAIFFFLTRERYKSILANCNIEITESKCVITYSIISLFPFLVLFRHHMTIEHLNAKK